MAKTTFAEHPLHPQLVNVPAALLPFSLVLDLAHGLTGKASYADAAYYSMLGGFLGGLASAAAGAGDYFTIPPGGHVKKIANLHASLNLGVLGLYSLNLLLRRSRRPPTGTLPVLLSAVGTAGLVASAWFGGHLVFEHGVRVAGVSPIAEAPEAKLPGDHALAQALTKLEALAPQEGPNG